MENASNSVLKDEKSHLLILKGFLVMYKSPECVYQFLHPDVFTVLARAVPVVGAVKQCLKLGVFVMMVNVCVVTQRESLIINKNR
jgi:hypothetical protein